VIRYGTGDKMSPAICNHYVLIYASDETMLITEETK